MQVCYDGAVNDLSQRSVPTLWSRLALRLNESGVFDPPLAIEIRERTLRAFLVLGILAEFTGPAVDVLDYIRGNVAQPFFPSSLSNVIFAFLFATLLALGQRLPLNVRVRIVTYAGIVIGVPALHYLGGALSTAIGFLAVPLAIAVFFLSFWESTAVLGLVLAGWWGLLRFEETTPPVEPLYGFARLHASYAVSGLTAFWLLLVGLFGAYRRSERLRSEQATALAEQNRALNAALSARDAFLAIVNHELRTPLTTIVGLSDLLTRQTEETSETDIRRLHHAAVHLMTIIDNLLDLSRVRTDAVRIQREPTDVAALAAEVTGLFATATAHPEVELRTTATPKLPPKLQVDREKLRRILANLVANAVKATTHGWVHVQVDYANGDLVLCVQDTGCGFDPSAQRYGHSSEALAPSTTDNLGESMGLGLRIVCALVDRMEGALAIHSDIGRGTTATVRLPAAVVDAPASTVATLVAAPAQQRNANLSAWPSSANKPAPVAPGSVLIVDDHADIRSLFKVYCETLGLAAHAFATPEDVVAYLNATPDASVAAVLMDILMPGTDGIAGRAMVEAALGQRCAPIVALTAHAAEDARANLREHGFAGILSKPIGLEQFETALKSLLAR